jgi:hypothetical protein
LYITSYTGVAANLPDIVNITHRLVVSVQGRAVGEDNFIGMNADTLIAVGDEQETKIPSMFFPRAISHLTTLSFPVLARIMGGGLRMDYETSVESFDFPSLNLATRINMTSFAGSSALNVCPFPRSRQWQDQQPSI